MTKNQSKAAGYSLRNRKLRRWIYLHNRTLPYVARKMGMKKEELKRKLCRKELFDKAQIRVLVHLVGARAAIDIIYFPTISEKRLVQYKTFGRGRPKE